MKLYRYALAMLASLALTACATLGLSAETPEQKLYASHSAYNIVLARVVAYAESPQADPAIVAGANDINQEIAPKLRYAHAFIACTQPEGTRDVVIIAAEVRCGDFRFDKPSVVSATSAIASATQSLLALLRSKGVITKWETSSKYSYG